VYSLYGLLKKIYCLVFILLKLNDNRFKENELFLSKQNFFAVFFTYLLNKSPYEDAKEKSS